MNLLARQEDWISATSIIFYTSKSYPPLPLNSRGPQGKHMQSFVAFVFALVSTERAYNIPVDLDLEGLT